MKQQRCQLCEEKLPKNKLVYNKVYGGYLCLFCYTHQFPTGTLPAYPFWNKELFETLQITRDSSNKIFI